MESEFDRLLTRAGTDSVKWGAYAPDVLPLFVADMDFPTPRPVVEAILARAEQGVFGYTRPGPSLEAAVTGWFREEYGFSLPHEWLVWVPAVVPALKVACSMAKSEVLTTVPNYSGLLRSPQAAGKRRIDSPLRQVNGRYEMDFDDLEKRAGPDTELFLLCNPHNPVGRVYTPEELRQLAEFAQRRELVVVSDEIHCELLFEGRHTPYVTLPEELIYSSITLMSPAKTCNIPGLSAAFAIIPDPALRKRFEAAAFALPRPNILNFAATEAAYARCGAWKRELTAYLRENRDYLEREFRRRLPRVVVAHPEAMYLLWLDFRAYGIEDPYTFFLEKAKIAFTNGRDFGGPGFARLNFGCPRAILAEALERIEKALAQAPAKAYSAAGGV